MKNLWVFVLCFMLLPGLCLAKDKDAAPVLSGRVVGTSLGLPAKNILSEIVIVDDAGQRWSLWVEADAAITGHDGLAMPFDAIKPDDHVVLGYRIIRLVVKNRLLWKVFSIQVQN